MAILSADARPLAWLKRILGAGFARTGLHPIAITFLGLVVVGVGAWLVVDGRFVSGAFVLLLGAGLDGVDGAVARHTGKVTAVGGYLDSIVDRYADLAVVFAMAAALDETWLWWVALAALFGTVTTSYAKAHLYEIRRPPEGYRMRAFLERQDRYLIALPAILLHGIALRQGWEVRPMVWGLVALAVLSNLATLQRVVASVRLLHKGL